MSAVLSAVSENTLIGASESTGGGCGQCPHAQACPSAPLRAQRMYSAPAESALAPSSDPWMTLRALGAASLRSSTSRSRLGLRRWERLVPNHHSRCLKTAEIRQWQRMWFLLSRRCPRRPLTAPDRHLFRPFVPTGPVSGVGGPIPARSQGNLFPVTRVVPVRRSDAATRTALAARKFPLESPRSLTNLLCPSGLL